MIFTATSFRELNFQFDLYGPGDSPEARRRTTRPPGSRCHPRIAQFRDSQQVVRGTGNKGRHLRLRLPDESRLAQAADRLQPAKDFLHPLSLALTDSIALGSRRPTIEPGRVAIFDSGDMRSDLMFAQMRDEVLHVVALVGCQRLGVNAPPPGPESASSARHDARPGSIRLPECRRPGRCGSP